MPRDYFIDELSCQKCEAAGYVEINDVNARFDRLQQ